MSEEMNITQETVETEATEEQKYSIEEVNEMLQKEGDRRVSSAEKKWAKKISALEKQIANEKSLSQLDEDARATAEKDMRIAELEDQLKDFQVAQTRGEVMKTLNGRGLSAEFADLLNIGADAEEAQKTIEAFDKLFKKEVEREVKSRLAANSNIPQMAEASSGKMTKEEFMKLPIATQQAMYNSDPELVNQFIGG